jgi:hypothetical protein
MGFVEGETGACSETCVTCDVDGTGEVSIKVEDTVDIKEEVSIKEEAIDIKDEIPKAIVFPPIRDEHEVRLHGMFEVVAAHAFSPFIPPPPKKRKFRNYISLFPALVYIVSAIYLLVFGSQS